MEQDAKVEKYLEKLLEDEGHLSNEIKKMRKNLLQHFQQIASSINTLSAVKQDLKNLKKMVKLDVKDEAKRRKFLETLKEVESRLKKSEVNLMPESGG